jgi:NADH dehydrogenase [ubiquinone] 1 alpha subcomplex assembly factor 5
MESTPPILFNRDRLRKRRARAATTFNAHDFLWREAAARAEESLSYILRDFERVAVFGGHAMHPPRGCKEWLVADTQDEEALNFAPESLDAILCLLNLHWVNDLPGCLIQMRRALKPDGLFMAILPGGESLRELRDVFAQTEAARSGGISPRIAPFIDVRDGGALLQRAGFALPVADSEILTVSYENLFTLMADLRGSGQVNMLQQQVQHFTPRGFFIDAAKRYAKQYSDEEGRITATVELVTLTGWKPAANQQQPLAPGSAKHSLKDALR